MDEFDYDYALRTVGEGITKYEIPDDWYAEFETYDNDNIYPIIVIQVGQIRKNSALINLKLRIVTNPDEEHPGCVVLREKKTILFKIDFMADLVMAMEAR